MKYIARWRAMIAAAPLWIILSAVPAKAALYLYEINARIVGEPYSIAGSFTMDSSIGPTSVSNINIQATGLAVSGPFTFSFNGVYEPNLTWPNASYLWFVNDAYNINNRFWMGLHYDTSLNDGSYLIGMWGNPFNPHPSELNIAGIGNWQYFTGEVTPILAPVPEPATWSMMILGFLGLGFLAYRRNGFSFS